MLAGVPTVVYGYFALTFVGPLLKSLGLLDTPASALSAGLVMGVMLLPTVAYVLLGSSRQLVIGPEGSISTLVAAAILSLAVAGSADAAELAAMLALLVAACFALAWVLREPNVASAIIGASRPEQVRENAGASGVVIDTQLFLRAEAIDAHAIASLAADGGYRSLQTAQRWIRTRRG